MKKKLLICLLFILFIGINYIGFIYKDKQELLEMRNFYKRPFKWKLIEKYIDSNSHMNHTLVVKALDSDSQIFFTVSGNFPSSLYVVPEVSDTLIKNSFSLLITVKNGAKFRNIQCDSWYWSEKPKPEK